MGSRSQRTGNNAERDRAGLSRLKYTARLIENHAQGNLRPTDYWKDIHVALGD